ncbi:MAG: molybdate ABC transporter ATP-binding protein ModF [Succinivibrionaceae bacterium]|nr:molybdate ABC transporter ATP-binding protein ModF [Succinivibrionaceae bacterium]
MGTITFEDATFSLGREGGRTVSIGTLSIGAGGLLALIGGTGQGKTSVARALAGELPLCSGSAPQGTRAALVSLERQAALLEEDFRLRNDDTLSPEEERGITLRALLGDCQPDLAARLVAALGLAAHLDAPIRTLSGGEGRKALLAGALAGRPGLLVLDTPFEALDPEARAGLRAMIAELRAQGTAVALIVNRQADIPADASALGLIAACRVVRLGPVPEVLADPDARALLSQPSPRDCQLPEPPHGLAATGRGLETLVSLRDVCVTYQRPVLSHLDFTVRRGEHWLIKGPNGAGKSTLLSLITGDNPLTYANNVTVLGMRRGSGESIWDVRRGMGMVSGALHLDYRVSSPALAVIISGLYDSIGLYRAAGDDDQRCAREWLRLLGMGEAAGTSFRSLSFGQQRLLLIARAMVKRPPLLILDEPCQGLDATARALVGALVSRIMANGSTSVLFVSHYEEDVPAGMTHRLEFVRQGEGYEVVQGPLGAGR